MTNQTIQITKPTPNEYALLYELARTAFAHNPRVLAIVERADLWEQYMEQVTKDAAAKRKAEAEAQAELDATNQQGKSAVETHGINSPEAQAKREERAAKRKADAEATATKSPLTQKPKPKRKAQRDAKKAADEAPVATDGDTPVT